MDNDKHQAVQAYLKRLAEQPRQLRYHYSGASNPASSGKVPDGPAAHFDQMKSITQEGAEYQDFEDKALHRVAE